MLTYVPYAFGGAMLVASFAFAGHYMGRNADAHSLIEEEPQVATTSPVSTLIQKGSLMPSDATLDLDQSAHHRASRKSCRSARAIISRRSPSFRKSR